MRKRLHEWLALLGSAFPTALSPYWRAVPLVRMKMFLVAIFLIGAATGFVFDLLQLDAPSAGHGLFWPVLVGSTATALYAAAIKKVRLIPALYVLLIAIGWPVYRASHASAPSPVPHGLQRRILFDAIGILVGVGVGSRVAALFAGTVGLDSVRMQTELALAHGIQATLVPAVSFQNRSFEVYGQSIPSAEMGGDLVDAISSDGGLLTYVADISGYGLAAGQLMGMLKAVMRVAVEFRQQPVAILETADRVLPGLKAPDMFATLALLHFDHTGQAEYALAGHVPILHYRDYNRDTVELSMEQFPLGLIPGGDYCSARVSYVTRDLFLMVTDGITEVANENDEEFGLPRLKRLLTQSADRPLPEICDLILDEVNQHGRQRDDQSLLLLRCRDDAPTLLPHSE